MIVTHVGWSFRKFLIKIWPTAEQPNRNFFRPLGPSITDGHFQSFGHPDVLPVSINNSNEHSDPKTNFNLFQLHASGMPSTYFINFTKRKIWYWFMKSCQSISQIVIDFCYRAIPFVRIWTEMRVKFLFFSIVCDTIGECCQTFLTQFGWKFIQLFFHFVFAVLDRLNDW